MKNEQTLPKVNALSDQNNAVTGELPKEPANWGHGLGRASASRDPGARTENIREMIQQRNTTPVNLKPPASRWGINE